MPRLAKSWTEWDVVYSRRYYPWLQRPGVTSWWKRKMRRDERRAGKASITQEVTR